MKVHKMAFINDQKIVNRIQGGTIWKKAFI